LKEKIEQLQDRIIRCERCPRLAAHRRKIAQVKIARYRDWNYWGRPVPSLGDVKAKLLVLGLAPAAHGGNRTGRMFTGDKSGDWLYNALHVFGFANQPASGHRSDGLKLIDCYVTASAHCAPPDNKPSKEELSNCRPYLLEEISLLKRVKVVIALGRIAFDTYLACRKERQAPVLKKRPLFGHGLVYHLPEGVVLIASYHPSQQNTHTGRLTRPMFHAVFRQARRWINH